MSPRREVVAKLQQRRGSRQDRLQVNTSLQWRKVTLAPDPIPPMSRQVVQKSQVLHILSGGGVSYLLVFVTAQVLKRMMEWSVLSAAKGSQVAALQD